MRSVLAVVLVAVIAAVVSANPYSQAVNNAANTLTSTARAANVLDLSGSYGWAFSVTDQIKAQIKACQDAIKALNEAVIQAENNKNNAYSTWQNTIQAQAQAQSSRDSAKASRDNAQGALTTAQGLLEQANSALDRAVAELRDATEDYSRKDGVWKLAVSVRDYEVPKKTNDISELCQVLTLIGVQHGDKSSVCEQYQVNSYDATLRIAVDDESIIYLNGNALLRTNNWNTPFETSFKVKTGDVLYVHALNSNWGDGLGNPGAVIGVLNLGSRSFPTNAQNWRCTAGYVQKPTAAQVKSWPAAVEIDYPSFRAAYPSFPQEQKVIWKADNYKGGDTATCAIVIA